MPTVLFQLRSASTYLNERELVRWGSRSIIPSSNRMSHHAEPSTLASAHIHAHTHAHTLLIKVVRSATTNQWRFVLSTLKKEKRTGRMENWTGNQMWNVKGTPGWLSRSHTYRLVIPTVGIVYVPSLQFFPEFSLHTNKCFVTSSSLLYKHKICIELVMWPQLLTQWLIRIWEHKYHPSDKTCV